MARSSATRVRRESPSAWRPRLIIAAFALTGFLISLYLTLYQLYRIPHVWDPFFGAGSHDVLRSRFSFAVTRILGIPDAALGMFFYALECVLALVGSTRRWETHPWRVLLFGILAVPPALASFGLVMLQAFVIKKWCFLCLCSAACSFAIIILIDREVSPALKHLIALRNARRR